MPDPGSHDVKLTGCLSQPLMGYLKALAVFRLVSEQKDEKARGFWSDDAFLLRSSLDLNTLTEFFLKEYAPTPIVVPWSGGDFFSVNWGAKDLTFSRTPTAANAVEAVLATDTLRLGPYRNALYSCKTALDRCGIQTKKAMEGGKWEFIEALRSICHEEGLIDWIDAAAVINAQKFASLLGSGGGSDGNTHFSDNFIQNLWDVLPDFDGQRKPGRSRKRESVENASREQLADALFATGTNRLVPKRTSSLYNAGAVGGPNASQGMERESLANPWSVILALEGAVSFATAAVKRLAANAPARAAFPFQVSASPTDLDSLSEKERAGKELWLPLWKRPVLAGEVFTLLREGRAVCGVRPADTGVDMARAVATLGIDRGVSSFQRYAIVKGRVGGENYNTSTSLGRFEVHERPDADLLRQADMWLDTFRRATRDRNAPARLGTALYRIDSAVLDFCLRGDPASFQRISVALGNAESELRTAEKFVHEKNLRPLSGLSSDWIFASDDGSPEFALGLAFASIYDAEGRVGPLRANLEGVDWTKRPLQWAVKERAVVWNAADLATNLANVLQRRVMDGDRQNCRWLPLAAGRTAPLDAVSAFLAGELDDRRIENLLWGLMLVRPPSPGEPWRPGRSVACLDAPPLPRDYALLKLLFLPYPLAADRKEGRTRWRYARQGEAGISIRPEPRVLPLLRAGRLGEACRIAAQRLRVSGLAPMPGPSAKGRVRDGDWGDLVGQPGRGLRLAAALLAPLSSSSVNRLVRLVCRDECAATQSIVGTE